MNKGINLILGGSRSGKSQRAEQIAAQAEGDVIYIATYQSSQTHDPEMADRIKIHQEQRPSHWQTVENEFDLEQILKNHMGKTLLIDCLTLWLGYQQGETASTNSVLEKLRTFLQAAKEAKAHVLIVSNEVGMGLVPLGKENREYRDLCGWANQLVAKIADNVEFVAAGIPLTLKSAL